MSEMKSIKNITTGDVYASMTDAASGSLIPNLAMCCKLGTPDSNGHLWKYIKKTYSRTSWTKREKAALKRAQLMIDKAISATEENVYWGYITSWRK